MGKRKSQAASGSAPERMSADDFMALVDTKKREYKAGASGSTNMSADSFMALVEAKKRQLSAGTVQSAPDYRRKSGTSLPSSQASSTKAMLDSSPDGGYGNYDATYSPARQGLSESSARYLRQQHYQQDKADYDAAKKRYQEAQERASSLKDERRLAEARARLGDGKYSDSYFTDLAKREREAREAVGSAEDAMLPYKNRVDAYDATWGKVDKYADTVEKAKGTKGSYSGPSFEDMAAWEKQRSEDAMDQQMAAFRDAAYEDPENGPKVEDRLGFWLNLTEDQKQQETVVSGNAKHWGNLTKDEISAYYYLRQNQGQEAADQYLDDMENELSRREDAKFVKKVENAEGAELVGLNAASVAGNVLGGVPAAVDKAVGAVTGKQNPYSSGQMWQRYAGYVRGYTGQKVSDWAENGLKGVAGQEWAERAGNLAKQTYQAVMSGVDSAAGALVFGRGVGIPAGPFTMHVGGYTTVMGLGAAAQRAQEMQLQGATDTQIALGSIGSGILEALFEDVSAEAFFENILENPATTAKEFTKKLATQMGVEASEEVCTEIGNLIWDSAVRGKNSDHQQAEREYMEQGMSRQDAKTQAALDSAMDIFWAGYGGAISAGASSVVGQAFAGGQQAIEKARSNYEFGNYMAQNGGNVLDLAEQAETLTDEKAGRKLSKQAEKLAMELRDKEEPGVRGKYRMGKIAGDIADQAQKESSEADVAAFREVAKNYLKDQENIKSPKRAEKLLVKAYTGEYMTRAEQVYFNSIGGKDLFTKVVDSAPYGSIQEAAETKQSKALDTVMGLVDSASRETTIHDVAAQYGKQAGAVERVYNMADTGSVTPENFGESFDAVYQKGAMGLPITEALKNTGVLTQNQAEMAYRIGTDAAGSYKSSDSGQAYITESREPVVVSSVESISEDGLTLKMDDGQTVNAKNVTFGSPEESMVYTTVGEVFQKAEDANRALTAWQNTGVSGTAFASALRDGYQKGRSGVDFARIRPKTEAGKLTKEIRKMAWEAGKASVEADTAKKETKLKSGTHKKAEAGLKVDQSVKDLKSYSRQQKTTLDLAKVLSKTGFSIEVFASTEEQRKSGVENGSFNTEDGSIRIDLNAGLNGEGLAAYALAHEVTHFAREFSPAKYQIFAETLIEAVNKSETSFEAMLDLKAAELSKLEAYQSLSETKLYDVAQDEVVAEMCETIFTNTDAAQRLSQRLYAKDQSLWGKFKSFMSDLVGRLKEAYAGLNPDSPIARRMKETVTQSENVLNAWVEAVAGAVENFNLQDGQKNDAQKGVMLNSDRKGGFLTEADIYAVQSIGRKSLNSFTAADIQKTESFAKQYWKEMGVKSPFFRSWFGDWRANDRTPIRLADKLGSTRGLHHNNDTGWEINISGKIFDENKSHKSIANREARAYMPYLDSIVANAVLLDSSGSNPKSANTLLMHSLYAVSDIGNGPEVLKLYVEEMNDPNSKTTAKRTYNLQNIEKAFNASKRVQGNTSSPSANASNAIKSVADLFAAVKRMDANFNPNSVSELLLNEDGTPKKLYRYTNLDDTVIKPDYRGAIWMADNDWVTSQYGSRYDVLYANMRNPYVFNVDGLDFSEETALVNARKGGHDGLIIHFKFTGENNDYYQFMVENAPNTDAQKVLSSIVGNSEGLAKPGETIAEFAKRMKESRNVGYSYYAVFDQKDVKSATDNIGTFDGSNPDIRYSSRTQQDTEYMNLAKEPEKNRATLQQMVDQAAKDAGYTRLFYHGSKKGGGFTVFKDWQYFTGNRDYARRYAERGNDKSLYTTYVKMENPFDTRIDAVRDIFEDARMEYGMGELQENGLPDWTDGYDIADYIDENDLPYDSIVLDEGGDMVNGKPVSRGLSYVVRKSNQVKSADTVTYDDSGNVIPLSQRFNTDAEDIRYSRRGESAQRQLDRQQAEIDRLKELLNIQKYGNKNFTLDRNSVEKAASALLKSANAGGSKAELISLLDSFYRYLGTSEDLTWESVSQEAQKAVNLLVENRKTERDPYNQEVLDWMKGRHVALSQEQISEAEYLYGSLKEFRKALGGAVVLDQKANTTLDQFWQEAANQYADKFSADTTDVDMPGTLAELVDSLRNGESLNTQEARYYEQEIRRDLTRQVYDSYWDVKPVQSVRDDMQKKLDLLKVEHRQAMEAAKAAARSEREKGQKALEDYRKQRDVVETTMMAAYAKQQAQVEQAYQQEMAELRKTYGADTAAYQDEFFAAMKNKDFQNAHAPTLRKMLNELAKDNSGGSKDAEAARKQVYGNLLKQYALELANSGLEDTVKQQREDSGIWEREFKRIAKECEKRGGTIEDLRTELKERVEELQNNWDEEAKALEISYQYDLDAEKANTAIVEKEFARLLRIYEAARQNIQRLEGKVKQQREAAQAKVESRRRTELRKKISDKAKVFQKMALAPAKSNTAHAPVALMGALSDFCTIFYESEARAVQQKQSELAIRETVNRSKLGIEQVSRALDQDARKRLSEIGGVYNVEGTAKAIVKQLTFEKLNREEKALVSGKAAKQVLSELQSRAERYLGDVQGDSSPALKKESEIIARKKELLGRRAEALQKLQKAYGDLRKDSVLEIFHDDHVQKLVDSLSGMLAESDISGMNAEQLEDVYNVMKAMEYTIVNANKVFSAGKDKTLIGMTNKLSKEIKAVTVKHSPAMNSIRKYWMWQMSPDTFFNSICGYAKGNEGKAIQQMFVTGMERMMGTQREFYQMFRPLTEATDKATAKSVRELMSKPLKGMVSWGLKNVDGQEVKTSKGMMLQAYMLLNQEDSFNSILYGGFKIPRMEEYYGGNRSDAYSNAETNQLLSAAIGESYMDLVHDIQEARQQGDQAQADALQTKAEEMTRGAVANLIAIRDQLSATIQADPTMSALVDTAAKWYKRSGELLAEVYEGMYGYKPNLVDGYTPIHRDLTTVKTDIREDSSATFNLENIGLTKERVKSFAPIKLTDFFQELSDHTQQISRFYGFAQVQKDFNRIWNLKMPGSRSTVNTLVADKYGAGKSLFGVSGEEYINNYIKSVAGSSGGGSVLERFYGSAASATLSLNPRVAFSQLASIPTAAAEVGWGSMARGFAKGFTVGLSGQKKSILANDSIWFWQRYRGAGGSTEFSDLAYKGNLWSRVSGSKAGKALFNWCQSFDVFATSSMWAMAEDAVQHQQGLTPGTDGYQAAVEQKYADIIRKSQPNYTVTERSDLLRDKRAGMKLLTMYKTQSNQNLNILMNAWGEYKATMEGIKAGDGLYTQADKAAAGRKLANGITSVTIGGTLAFVLLRTAVNLIMGNLKYYRDDETDEMTVEGLVSGMVGEVLSSTAGMFALGGQLEEILYSAITGGRYYGISDSGISVIATAAEDGQKVLSTIFNREMEDGQKWQYLKKYSANLFYSVMTACSVPAKNAKTMLDAVGTWYTALTKGIPAAMESGDTTATQYRARILRGWQEGDMGKIKDTLAILAANSEEDTDEKVLKDVTSGVAQYLKKAFMKNQISGEEAQKLLAYIGHESPEETVQNWVFKKMYPDSDLSNAGIAKWNSYQDIPLDVFEAAYKYKGEHGKKAEIVAYIRGLNISTSMKKRLWDAIKGNWKDEGTPWN